jgi:phosphatidylcholine synthase
MSESAVSDTARQISPARRTLAWGVHLFTASGAVVGALALLAIGAGELSRAALLMLLALFIDSVDGTLARKAQVAQVLPGIDGRRLDDIVDYLNYVIVPAVFMVWAGNLAHWGWAALPILASAYGFSQEHAKTHDDFFLGWPSYWNVVAIYLWLLELGPVAGTIWVAVFSAAIFVPLRYIHPSRLPVLRQTTNLLGLLWGALLVFSILAPQTAERLHAIQLSLAFPAYYLALSFWIGGLHRREA